METAAESKLKKKEHDRKEELGLVSADEGEEEYDELSYRVERFKTKYSVEESKERDATFAAPMKVKVRLTVKDEDGSVRDITEQDVFMGDFPLMTRTGLLSGKPQPAAAHRRSACGAVHLRGR